MAIKPLYPAVLPSLDLNFAATKRLDPRVTFSRVGSGTYFDSGGVLRTVPAGTARFDHNPTTGESLGLLVEEARTNQITNSNFWSTSIPNGRIIYPNATVSPDGNINAFKFAPVTGLPIHNCTFDYSSFGTANNCTLSIFAKLSDVGWGVRLREYNNTGYTASFDLSSGTASTTGGTTAYMIPYPNGWYRCIWLYSDSNSNTSFFQITLTGDTANSIKGAFIYGMQIEEGSFPTSYIPTPATFTGRASTATFYDANGTVQTVASGVARSNAFFPDSNGVMRPAGLLLEEAGTNLVGNSASASGGFETSNTTQAYGIAPNGTNTSIRWTPPASFTSIRAFFNVTAGVQYTCSIFLKGNSTIQVVPDSSLGGGLGFGRIDLSTKITTGYAEGSRVELLSNGWVRLSFRKVATSTGQAQLNLITYNNQAADIEFWGAQVEAGIFSTSYVPTSGSTVTRAADTSTSSTVTRSADVASITGTNFSSWYNQNEGTLFQNCISRAPIGGPGGSNAGVGMLMVNSITGAQMGFFRRADSTALETSVYTGSTSSAFWSIAFQWPQNIASRAALTYKTNDFAVSANGLTVQTDTLGIVPTMTQLDIGQMSTAVYNRIGAGTFSRLTYWPTRLLDSTLQAITR